MGKECNCGEGHGGCDCGCDCCGGDNGFERQYLTKAEQIEELEEYQGELKAELKAVEEHLADLRK
jgi:hypothetical protein